MSLRVQVPRTYLDNTTSEIPTSRVVAINMVPEQSETSVKVDQILHLTLASLDNLALDLTAKVWVRINLETEELVYDQDAGGFQTGWDASESIATVRQSTGSGVNDELVLAIQRTTDYPSQARVRLRWEAETV